MKATRCFYICFVLSLLAGAISAKAQGTAFTYQGRLTESSGPAEGWYDFRFEIYNAETGGSPLAGPVTGTYVASNGLFTATLDFGTNIFDGGPRWVEISVRTNDASNAYTTLVPRQRITAAPYAMTAGTVTGPIPSDSFSGTFSNAVRLNNRSNEFTGRFEGDGAGLSNVTVTLPASVAHVNSNQLFSGVNQFQNGANVFAGSFIGDGVRVENVDAARLNGFAVTHFWQTGGNGETDPRTNFLGTTDRQALELRVNNERGLRIEPTRSNDTVNVLGGSGQNQIAADVISATIAGGGTPLFGGGARPNIAESDFATISGGAGNRIAVDSPKATIGGGFGQSIGSNTPDGTIAGGHSHVISSNSSGATISGGGANTIGAGGTGATISGGWENTVRGQAAVVGGGNGNSIGTNSWNAVIGGGYVNAIDPDAGSATIGGGGLNVIKRSFYATIGGGWQNVTHGDASGILSGFNNTIETNTWTSVIGGGYQNTIRRDAGQAVIGGGFLNRIAGSSSAIGGGGQNQVEAAVGTIAGGWQNTIGQNAGSATIGGGNANIIGTNATYATIPGGTANVAAAPYSFAAGQAAQARHYGAFVWNDAVSPAFPSTGSNQFLVRASGGVGIGTNNPRSALHVAGIVTATGFSGPATGLTDVNAATVGGMTASSFWQLNGNVGTTPGTHFVGTVDNQPVEIKVNGARALRLEPTTSSLHGPNVIAGSRYNTVTPGTYGATIAGGGGAHLQFFFTNQVLGNFGTVGGGSRNTAAASSTVAGGSGNTATGSSSIGGGFDNNASGSAAVIAGGRQNTNSGQTATIGGGERSVASGAWATVGGGYWNTSSGSTATVPGGRLNTAGGARSFAAGTQAKALHDGTFVWGDSTLSDFASTAANQVLLRASGGVGIGLNNPQAQLDVSSGGGFNSPQLAVRQTSPSDFARIRLQASGPAWDIALSPGAGAASSLRFWNGAADNLTLQDNGNANLRGTLFQGSDRNTKERVEPVNASAVLEKVLELPLNTWSYTNSPSVRHLGPMAQDFHGAFGLGDTDRGIASVDADGVALAAIQGLNGKLEEQLRQKDEEISDLKKRLEKLERLVGK